ncbi:DUF5995 family protein [Nocardia pseudobrasiliensis]|uniref:Zinc dependent phospholipase C n=1 Tax=Nocardia pseudobrasiliensis TaxID=45979 RepID=A0A370IBH0_9NOCA|nr:DUF5995 family protein [Nocardia pseudobrasiliensis]RDI68053.1 hypothetical protein DFR76_102454 [Nocardia pseudobrasiliensis]
MKAGRSTLFERIGFTVLVALVAALAPVGTAANAQPAAPTAVCGTALSDDELDTIARLSQTSDLTGDSLARLETAVARLHEITEILVAHHDRRGLFGVGLDTVEQAAVMPLQRDPAAFQDREYAHRISLELLSRYLDNLHAEFTGGPLAPQWARYFDATRRCELSGARVAMTGYAAHLVVDLSESVAAIGSEPRNAPDYFEIVAAIAETGDLIVDRTRDVYAADLGPLWRFYFFGEGLDLLLGRGVATRPLLVLADLGANVVIFGNGLALRDPALHDTTAAEMWALFDAADTAFAVLAQIHAL